MRAPLVAVVALVLAACDAGPKEPEPAPSSNSSTTMAFDIPLPTISPAGRILPDLNPPVPPPDLSGPTGVIEGAIRQPPVGVLPPGLNPGPDCPNCPPDPTTGCESVAQTCAARYRYCINSCTGLCGAGSIAAACFVCDRACANDYDTCMGECL